MSIPRRPAAAPLRNTDRPFWGYDRFGHLFRSAQPIQSATSNFVAAMRRQVRSKFMSPADVAYILRTQPDYIRTAFPCAAAEATMPQAWVNFTRPHQWGAAGASTSAEEDIKRNGPADATDENALQLWLEQAEQFHGLPCRFAGLDPGAEVEVLGGTLHIPNNLDTTCATHPRA